VRCHAGLRPKQRASANNTIDVVLADVSVICFDARMMAPMPAIEFPRHRVGLLQELGAHALENRTVGSALKPLARALLAGFYDICERFGLDGVLVGLEQAFPPLDITDRSSIDDHPTLLPALVAQLGTIDLDGGGPRNLKPRLVADALVAALGLTLADEPDRTIVLDDKVRAEVAAALASVVDPELAVPHIRETIIATARAQCEAHYHGAFDRIAKQLDERGMRMLKQPNVPLDASQAVERALFDARAALLDRVARAAIDRAKPVLARASADAAARIDEPITHRLTPRDVAILRASDAHLPKTPRAVVDALLQSLTEAGHLEWRAPERPVRTYSPKETFAVGDLLDHPKFGRGTVISGMAQRIDVEFADGKHTLVHVKPTK